MRTIDLFLSLVWVSTSVVYSQAYRWQQEADYTMEIDFDVESHQFTGTQSIRYKNNSPKTVMSEALTATFD